MGRSRARAEAFGLSAREIVLLVERNGDGAVQWFGSFPSFPRVSAFGSGLGGGKSAGHIIIIFFEENKKAPKNNGFRNYCAAGENLPGKKLFWQR